MKRLMFQVLPYVLFCLSSTHITESSMLSTLASELCQLSLLGARNFQGKVQDNHQHERDMELEPDLQTFNLSCLHNSPLRPGVRLLETGGRRGVVCTAFERLNSFVRILLRSMMSPPQGASSGSFTAAIMKESHFRLHIISRNCPLNFTGVGSLLLHSVPQARPWQSRG